jgi:hypothetical protein
LLKHGGQIKYKIVASAADHIKRNSLEDNNFFILKFELIIFKVSRLKYCMVAY